MKRIISLIFLPIWFMPFCLLVGIECLWDVFVLDGDGFKCNECKKKAFINKCIRYLSKGK